MSRNHDRNLHAPCASAGRILFGPDDAFTQWHERARRDLVCFPSEEALFDLASKGLDGYSPEAERARMPRLLPLLRLYTAAMGERGPGECARTLEGIVGGIM